MKKMKVLVAIDSFKGSLTSSEAGEAVKKGILCAIPDADVIVRQVSDGGEGMTGVLMDNLSCKPVNVTVNDPLMRKISTAYAYNADKRLAVMEMAEAAGLTLLDEQERNPLATSTYGVGEMISDAIRRGARDFIIGIGGSATNDGGMGMLQALGFEFLNEEGKAVSPCGEGLKDIKRINVTGALPELKDCHFRIACDVKNPLCGENGCSAVFGPQKGLKGADIKKMDEWLRSFADIAAQIFPEADKDWPGAGAAGGLGFAFRTFLNAELVPGIELVMNAVGLEDEIRSADFIVTGEGCLDAQSLMGKVPGGVAALAKKYDKPVIAFAGMIKEEDRLYGKGIDAMFPITREPMTLSEAMKPETAKKNLAMTAEQVFRAINLTGSGLALKNSKNNGRESSGKTS